MQRKINKKIGRGYPSLFIMITKKNIKTSPNKKYKKENKEIEERETKDLKLNINTK